MTSRLNQLSNAYHAGLINEEMLMKVLWDAFNEGKVIEIIIPNEHFQPITVTGVDRSEHLFDLS